MSSERTYNDDEVEAIIDRATKVEDRAGPGSGSHVGSEFGLTLSEIQKIGSEVGISPDAIAHSARSLSVDAAEGTQVERKLAGLPVGVGGSVELQRPLTSREWDELVVLAREHFNAHGKVDGTGELRSWRNGNLRVQLEPSGDSQRLRVRTFNQNAFQMMMAGAGMVAGGLGLGTLGLLRGDPDPIRGAVIVALIGGTFLVRHVLTVRGWADRRRAQMEDLMSRAVAMASRALPGGDATPGQLSEGDPVDDHL